ncbi:MAG: aminotransferase class V-fold PLP-dependent enzyme [Bacteroidota bacterium]|nr:aminotransferase class V-fold PLP-dependent enzyme [Bacteroidota bacterium]
MTDRRKFLRQLGFTAGAFAVPSVFEPIFAKGGKEQMERVSGMNPDLTASDDDFWAWVREQYTVNTTMINLNNGGVSPQPKPVQDAHMRFYQYCNDAPSYFMWRELDRGREPLRKRLAELGGVSHEEVAINRNSTEGLNTIIFGLNLKAGDEVVLSKQDYPNMINAWKQREKRDGIKLVWVNHTLPSEDEAALTKIYTSAFTDKTKVVHITHMINWVGQILPVRKIADEAHKKNIEVICDSAHTFGLIDYKIGDLGCDYWATSLHKWLCAPFGSGMLWIKKEKIKDVWALLSSNEPDGSDIRKFESLGTRSFASEMAISAAIDFHLMIGAKRKEARLRFLKNYWTDKVVSVPGVKIWTPKNPAFCGAIAGVSVEGLKPEDLEGKLMEKYRIHCVGINWENIHCARIAPNVYTSLADLDLLVKGIKEIAAEAAAPK